MGYLKETYSKYLGDDMDGKVFTLSFDLSTLP